MIRVENECIGCPPMMGCRGESCPNRHVVYLQCDECGHDVEELYDDGGTQLCLDCLLAQFPCIDADNADEYM